ncbi:MAG: Holliday junction branch migration protein RuvA [Deltaproteobacteria bacterium]|nr:Holliday junction branch migration protein RuvA [Deltaproteobacteria bacterium]
MIGFLRGNLLSFSEENLLIDVAGVGYEVCVTASVIKKLGSIGETVELAIYTDVKETSISLFGFNEQMEKKAFMLLKKVNGVGPRLAFAVVSHMRPAELFSALGTGDHRALQRVPGVGKKLAERLVVELKEQVGVLAIEAMDVPLSKQVAVSKNSLRETEQAFLQNKSMDAVLALEALGFSYDQARSAVQKAVQDNSAAKPELVADSGELVRLSLANL